MRFNTAISQLMIFVNEAMKLEARPRQLLQNSLLLLAPFAPHIAEEIWEKLGHTKSLAYEPWPSYDAAKTIEDLVEVVLQVNGKLRAKILVPNGTSEAELQGLALKDENFQRHVGSAVPFKVIVVKNKLVNVVVKH